MMANEKRLIDLDELVSHFRATKIDEVFPNWKELFPRTQAAIIRLTTKYRAIVLSAPIVDAVEVVRCKDCKHGIWDEENEMWKCVESAEYDEDVGEWFGFYEYHNEDFFCSYGERRTET